MLNEVTIGTYIGFDYVNRKGNKGNRKVKVRRIYYGHTEYHSEDQWLLKAWDYDKKDVRIFAMKDMTNINYW